MMTSRFCASGAVMVFALGIVGLTTNTASALGVPLPFHAKFSGTAALTSATVTSFSGKGDATYLGHVLTDGHAYISGSDSSCPGGVANLNVETLTASTGDTLTISSQDVACPTSPGIYRGSGHWTVTGGTGRYAHASGQGSYAGTANFNVGTFTITLNGSVALIHL
jgi:hypothetical protein